MRERQFTVEQADTHVPRLQALIERLQRSALELRAERDAMAHRLAVEPDRVPVERLLAERPGLRRVVETLDGAIEGIQALGVDLDAQTRPVDFRRSSRRGRLPLLAVRRRPGPVRHRRGEASRGSGPPASRPRPEPQWRAPSALADLFGTLVHLDGSALPEMGRRQADRSTSDAWADLLADAVPGLARGLRARGRRASAVLDPNGGRTESVPIARRFRRARARRLRGARRGRAADLAPISDASRASRLRRALLDRACADRAVGVITNFDDTATAYDILARAGPPRPARSWCRRRWAAEAEPGARPARAPQLGVAPRTRS